MKFRSQKDGTIQLYNNIYKYINLTRNFRSNFQHDGRVVQTVQGQMDDATMDTMTESRCGVTDNVPEAVGISPQRGAVAPSEKNGG